MPTAHSNSRECITHAVERLEIGGLDIVRCGAQLRSAFEKAERGVARRLRGPITMSLCVQLEKIPMRGRPSRKFAEEVWMTKPCLRMTSPACAICPREYF